MVFDWQRKMESWGLMRRTLSPDAGFQAPLLDRLALTTAKIMPKALSLHKSSVIARKSLQSLINLGLPKLPCGM